MKVPGDCSRSNNPAGLRSASELPSPTRRHVLALLVSSGAVAALSALLKDGGLIAAAVAATPDLTSDTLNGLAVFFVPGPDSYSLHQGESTPEPGGVETGAGEGLVQALNFANPFLPTLADVVAALLNATASAVNPGAGGPFQSAFANLQFADKGRVFAALEGNPQSAPLAGVLPLIVGFLAYTETAVFDPVTRTIVERPIGWDLSDYAGVADGRDDFKGYFHDRRRADA